MSVIAVKKYKDKIVIGADSQTTAGYSKEIKDETTKLIKINNNFIVGSAGYTKVNQLLKLFCETTKPKDNSEMEIIRFFKAFEDWLEKETNKSTDLSHNSFLFVLDKKIFDFYNYHLIEIKDFGAIGSGEDKAKAILSYADISKKEIDIRECLEAVSQIDLYCHTPIVTFEVKI